jgi:hypothetical protein
MSPLCSGLCPYLLSLMALVLVWRGISEGWAPASSARSRSDAERLCSVLRRIKGSERVFKVAPSRSARPLAPSSVAPRSRSYGLSVALALTGGAAALALPFYGDQILRAPSARAAAPFAAPFALLAASAAAAITLAAVALCDERRL